MSVPMPTFAKNASKKERAEVLAPIIMFLLLSLPKLLVDEDTSGASYYNPAAIFDPTWAGEQACPDENAFKLVYTPDDTLSTQVAADAGLKLYCNSFMNVCKALSGINPI